MKIRKVGVLGCGLMGAGIAEVAARAGYAAVVREVSEEKIDPFRERITAIREHRTQRDAGRVRATLESLHARASDREANLMGEVVAATEAGATMGEMAGVLRMAYGRPADPFGMLEDPI